MNFFLKSLTKLTREALWAWTFRCGKVFNDQFIIVSLINIGLFRSSISSINFGNLCLSSNVSTLSEL